jgi:hypothetical protein
MQSQNHRFADVVALRQFLERFTLRPPPPCFSLLLRREARRSAHVLPARLRPAAAPRRAGADQVAVYVRQPAKHGYHLAPGAGGASPSVETRT